MVGQIEDYNYSKKEINIIKNRKQTVLQIKNKKYCRQKTNNIINRK